MIGGYWTGFPKGPKGTTHRLTGNRFRRLAAGRWAERRVFWKRVFPRLRGGQRRQEAVTGVVVAKSAVTGLNRKPFSEFVENTVPFVVGQRAKATQ